MALTGALLLNANFAPAQNPAAPQESTTPAISGADMVMMSHAAAADCRAKLAAQIKGLAVSESLQVANAAAIDVSQSGFVEALVKGAKLEDPVFSGQFCIVKGKITLDNIVENLNRMITTINDKKVNSFESMKRYNTLTSVEDVGMGTVPSAQTVRTDAPADDTGQMETLAHLKGSGQAILMAMEAARLDAIAKLAGTLKGVNVAQQTTVYNCAAQSWTQATVDALVRGARVKRYFAVRSDLVCCRMEISLDTLVDNIQRNLNVFADGRQVSNENVRKYNGNVSTFPGVGLGAVISGPIPRPPVVENGSGLIGEVK